MSWIMATPIISSYMHPSSLFAACCELYESCLHAATAGHWAWTSASPVYFFHQQSAWWHFVRDLLQYYNSSCGQSSPRGRVVVKVRGKDLEMALGRNRNAQRCPDLTEIKKKSSIGSGFQCFTRSLHWDWSGRQILVSVQSEFLCEISWGLPSESEWLYKNMYVTFWLAKLHPSSLCCLLPMKARSLREWDQDWAARIRAYY